MKSTIANLTSLSKDSGVQQQKARSARAHIVLTVVIAIIFVGSMTQIPSAVGYFAGVLGSEEIATQFLRSTNIVARAANTDNAMLATKTWTGAVDQNWTINDNWAGFGGAGQDDDLVFPAGAGSLTTFNNFTPPTRFSSLTFTGPGYITGGAQLHLTNGMTSNVPAGTGPIFDLPVVLDASQTFANTSANTSTFVLNGTIDLSGHTLTVTTSCQTCSIEMSGQITSTGGSGTLTKIDPGTLFIAGNSAGFGSTNVNAGTLRIIGTLGTVNLNSGKLIGTGTTGDIVATGAPANGVINPGNLTGINTGTLTATAVTFAASSTFVADINGTTAGLNHDELHVDGQNVFLNGANLSVTVGNNFTPIPGQTFKIINETGAGILAGQFAQGTTITANNGRRFSITYNSNPGSVVLTALANTPFDFDGDGKSDVSVFRPSTGAWYLQQSQAGFTGVAFGQNGDLTAPGDYDGDGKTDIAVFRPSTGFWFLLRSTAGFSAVQFGQNGDLPRPGDFDGDGKADIAVFRPSNGTWFLLRSTAGFTAVQFGQNGDIPAIANFDGDAKSDVTVFRPSNGGWYSLNSTNGQFVATAFGQNGDIPDAADYDGDGKTDYAVFRPSTGTWYLLRSQAGFTALPFGQNLDIPAAGDFDGKADVAVFRPSAGTWFIQRSQLGFTGIGFGANGDKPIPSSFSQ